jgi:hypothetical protein
MDALVDVYQRGKKGADLMRNKLAGGLFKLGLGVIFAIALTASPGFAQKKGDTGQEPKMPPTMTEQTMTVSGKVTTVSAASVTVLDGQKNEHVIGLGPNTKVTKGGKEGTLADVKADDSVVVVASKGPNDALIAVTINVG